MFHIGIVESIHQNAIKIIENNDNYSFEIIQDIEENNLINKLKKCDAIALRTAKLTEKIINNCEKLKIVSRHGVGYDNVDIHSLNKKGIPLTITIHASETSLAGIYKALLGIANNEVTVSQYVDVIIES